MINLLPPSALRGLRKEYLYRLLLASMIALLAIACMSILLIFPSYVAVSARRSVVEREQAASDASPNHAARDSVLASLSSIKKLLDRASKLENASVPTDYLTPLLLGRPAGITFSSVSYQQKSGAAATITLEGIAITRDNLVGFITALRAMKNFSAVDLPVSDLADSVDIPFTITLTPTIKTP
jgi:hypothetical protein